MSRATRTPTAPATASQAQKLPQRPPPPRGGRPSSWTSRGFLFGVTRSASLAGAGGTASPAQSADDGTLAIQDEGWVYSPGSVALRSEEHTSELQSLMRISYAVFCLKKKKNKSTKYSEHTLNTTNQHEEKNQ